MKHVYAFLAVLIVVSLIACGKNSPTKPGGVSPNANGSSPGGTIDGGGGNTLNDKMLESYIVNPEDLAGYELISPLLGALKKIMNYTDPNDPFEVTYYSIIKIVLDKSWYLIPTDIKSITNDKIGVPFNEGTIQVAFQTFDAVWIDENAFNKMPLEEKAKLILHEIVMGLKILKFESDEKLFTAVGERPLKRDANEIVNLERLELNINSTDVSQVRTVTRKLWNLKDNVSVEAGALSNGFSRYDFGAMMVKYDFDRVVYQDKFTKIKLHEMTAGYKVESLPELFSELQSKGQYLSADFSPKKGAKGTFVGTSSCKFGIKNIGNDKAEVTLDITPNVAINKNELDTLVTSKRKTTFEVDLPKAIYYQFGIRPFFHEVNQMIELAGPGTNPHSKRIIKLYFDSRGLVGVEATERAMKTFIMDGTDGYTISKGNEFGSGNFLCNEEPEFIDKDKR